MISLVTMRSQMWFSQLFYLLLLFYSQLPPSSSFNSSSALLCSQHQSSALLHFKHLFSFTPFSSFDCDLVGQQSYPKMETWKEGTDCCSWDGVTCDSMRGDVIGLDLSCSWLSGTIPFNSTLFLLSHLQWLNLTSNDFLFSPIASRFGQFTRLKHLNLSYSAFSGQVPLELSHLSHLASLDLSDYGTYVNLEASVMKRLVQNLTKLRELHLNHVNMSSVPLSSLKNLSSFLTSLTLRECELHGRLPNNIFRLPNLRELSLAYNLELTWFFPMLNWTNSLRFLDLSYTIYTGELPESFGKIKFLRHLILSGCNFNGSIPAWLGNLTELTVLDLSTNNFVGELPSSLSNLNALVSLDLQSNHLNGELRMWLGNLTRVTTIFLKNNSFTGQIPSSLSFLKDLTLIDLSYNNFEGNIPNFLTNLTKLTQASLSYNQLTGQISEFQLGNSLEFLELNNNRLYGSIPKSISNLLNLTKLDISSNNLSGMVEFDKFTKLEKLESLDLSYNTQFSSIKSNFDDIIPSLLNLKLASCNITEFPNFIRSSTNLQILDLSNNRIYSRIPEWMFEIGENLILLDLSQNFLSSIEQLPWKNLRYLDLHANLLQGSSLPSMICNVSSLEVLDISHNNLGGTVPQCLGNFSKSILVMDLRINNFHGAIPDTFVKDNLLTTLVFNGNQLEGLLPKSLVNCTNLEVLDLGNNKINDFFPFWLAALPNLKVLILKSNRFHGPIGNHKTIGKFFTKLRILDLSHNEFIGLLPRNYLQNLNAMMTNDEGQEQQYMGETDYYHDLVVVTIKGLVIELQRILTIFTTIDLSSNKFEGEIPEVLGRLTILRLLNLSHNSLTGHIPSSLANLSALESLDLSSNRLTGEIPMELTSLTFLAKLNLSQNQLTGPIPQGNQFGTFGNDSYDGNLGLCGFPLSFKCGTNESPLPPLPSIFQEDYDSLFASGFGWKAVLIGYGCGFLFGLAMGYVMFKIVKPQWLVRFVEGKRSHKTRRPNNQS